MATGPFYKYEGLITVDHSLTSYSSTLQFFYLLKCVSKFCLQFIDL